MTSLVVVVGLFFSCQSTHHESAPTTSPVLPAATQASWREQGFRYPPARDKREPAEVAIENRSCVACHGQSDTADMHNGAHAISCIDCHGGQARVALLDADAVKDLPHTDGRFIKVKNAYHVRPTLAELWRGSSANPSAPGAATLQEDINFIRFVNPGDLRVAQMACGECHNTPQNPIIDHVRRNMMTHGAMLWEAALYNNGDINRKNAVYGETYVAARGADGKPHQYPASMIPTSQPTAQQTRDFGWLGELWPLPRWEISQPGNVLRVFERGGRFRPIVGIPQTEEDPGRPDVKLSVRGLGTDVRTDPVFIGLQKTRLLDPTLALFGTNDHPGDFRASGCSACHVVYANDRSPVHSGRWASYGNRGESFSVDRNVNPTSTTQPYAEPASANRKPREAGHPIAHTFVQNVPTSSCIVCHVHPGTNVLNSYLGFMWWDNETDGQFMYPRRQKYPTSDQEAQASQHNPEQAAARGLWSNLYPDDISQAGLKAGKDFLENITSLNPLLKHLQFADFHGHGWVFRAVFKQDRHGNLLNANGEVLEKPDAATMAAGVSYQTGTAPLPAGNADFSDDKFLAKVRKQLREAQSKQTPTTQAVHLKDVHLERGMQCVDCHFEQDNHGDGHLFGETRAAVTIECVDCHGSVGSPPVIAKYLLSDDKKEKKRLLPKIFTGAAAATQPSDAMLAMWEATVKRHFKAFDAGEGESPVLFQISTTDPKRGWYVKLVAPTVKAEQSGVFASDAKPDRKHFDAARYAHTVRPLNRSSNSGALSFGFSEKEQKQIADGKLDADRCLAHSNATVSCYACHSAWNTSCFGCHLPQRANQRKPMLHNEGLVTRNYTNYNYQTLRDDVYMLGVDSTVKGHKVVPVRSACAVMVSSQDAQRQWIYGQQQTISAEGFAGTAFSPYFPHTVRTTETKRCTDCHLSRGNDNNAIMAQLLMQGTNAVNFIGRYSWVAEGSGGLEAVTVAEREEPQAVIGSKLHSLAYPDYFAAHQSRGKELTEAHEHDGTVLDVQLRGEYLYAACGRDGFIAYDVANVDNKGFSERIITAPVSPLGQRLYVKTAFATSVCSPSTLALDPTRDHRPENEELYPSIIGTKDQKVFDPKTHQPLIGGVHPLYAFLYVTDAEEGLVVIGNRPDSEAARRWKPGVATLLDGDPDNNFLTRALAYNPGGLLNGARHMALYGHYAYVSCDAGLVVVDLDNPLSPRITKVLAAPIVRQPRRVAFQFRYGFVVDADGLKVLDVTDPTNPKLVPGARLLIPDARDVYVCRTFGYVAAGRDGLLVIDLEDPEALRPEPMSAAPFDPAEFRKPASARTRHVMRFDDGGRLNDATAVRVGMTNNSLYAYVADGRNGLKVLQLTSDETPGFTGFSPIPVPKLIAWHATRGAALSLSKGLDRDRAVDESGHQLSVFGRRGARPFTLEEQRRLYLVNPADPGSGIWKVGDDPSAARDLASP